MPTCTHHLISSRLTSHANMHTCKHAHIHTHTHTHTRHDPRVQVDKVVKFFKMVLRSALRKHDESLRTRVPSSSRVSAFTMSGVQCCLPGLGESLTFPATWTVEMALNSGLWVRQVRDEESPDVGKDYVFLEVQPKSIVHSNGVVGFPQEPLGMYGNFVYVLAQPVQFDETCAARPTPSTQRKAPSETSTPSTPRSSISRC